MKELREAVGLTQQEAAKALNVRRSTVSMWEVGASAPPVNRLMAIAELYDCTVEKLVERLSNRTING